MIYRSFLVFRFFASRRPGPPLNYAAGSKASIVASREGLGSSQSLLLYFTEPRFLIVSVAFGQQRPLLPAQQNEDKAVAFSLSATRRAAAMACPDSFAFSTPAEGTQLTPGELHFFTFPVDLTADPALLHVELAVQFGTGDLYLSVGNPFPQLAADGFRAGAMRAGAPLSQGGVVCGRFFSGRVKRWRGVD